MAERGNHEILLETGTNEIEIMEFTIDGNLYGINVAKVREILMSAPVHPMPHSHPAVEGIFKPRDIVITVVDLPKYLSGREEEKGEQGPVHHHQFQSDAYRVSCSYSGWDQQDLLAGYTEAG